MTEIPPPPAYAPTAGLPVQWWRLPAAPAPEPRPRIPDWRDPHKPDPAELLAELDAATDEDDQADEDEAPQAPDEPDHPDPEQTPDPTPPTPPTRKHTTNPITLNHRHQQLIYNATAAATGWWTGAGPWALNLMHTYGRDATTDGITAGLICITLTLPIDIRTRHWRHDTHPLLRALGWTARIPLATTTLALALYTPNATL